MDRDGETVLDMVHACRDIADFLKGIREEELGENRLVLSAVLRQLELIGEATKRLSDAFREANPSIPWKQMAGLRDRLIHAYDDIDVPTVWKVATRDVPDLIAALQPLLPKDQ